MYETQTLQQDLSSVQGKYHKAILLIDNDNSYPKNIDNTVEELQLKPKFLGKEKLSLKEEIRNK